jgi:3-deoxy-D-arabino-heptulosonate 7-phosphate (DAHP) synthase
MARTSEQYTSYLMGRTSEQYTSHVMERTSEQYTSYVMAKRSVISKTINLIFVASPCNINNEDQSLVDSE